MESNSTTNSSQSTRPNTPAVTTSRQFVIVDDTPLFTTKAGVPVSRALEQASIVLDCLESLVVSRASIDKDVEAATVQLLADMARALVDASCEGLDKKERKDAEQ